jgi:hypothetical protein
VTVHVDPAIWPASVSNGSKVHTSNWCHMTADSLPELHRFASGLGLRRSYFQDGTFPHYDLTFGVRFKAIRLIAIEIETRQSPDIARKLAETHPAPQPAPIELAKVLRYGTHEDVVQCACGGRLQASCQCTGTFLRAKGATGTLCLPCEIASRLAAMDPALSGELRVWADHNEIATRNARLRAVTK